MKKIIVLAIALIMISSASQAAKKNLDVKAKQEAFVESTSPAAPATATAVSMAELLKENQLLKSALLKSDEEKEALAQRLDYSQNMYFATVGLYENRLQKQQDDAKQQASYTWMMHQAILSLNAINADK
jgi:hypothetical protein